MTQRWDVFVSYAHEDEQWVQVLADNLHRVGLDVFLDQWEILGGSPLSQRLQQGLASSDVVVLVVSAAAVGKQWWQEEFAAAMAGAVAGVQRLVPVLVDEVRLPPFVASRRYVDFRHIDAPAVYEARFAELVRAVRGLPIVERPLRGGDIVVPPTVYRPEGPRLARLGIDQQRVVFSCADREVEHTPRGGSGGLSALVWEVQRARSRSEVMVKAPDSTVAAGVGISPAVKPRTRSLPSGASERRLSVIRSPPTGSTTMSTARSPTNPRTASSQPSLRIAWCAPQRSAKLRLWSSLVTATVCSPSARPSWMAATPTPPAPPCTKSVSPACARPRRTNANSPVR